MNGEIVGRAVQTFTNLSSAERKRLLPIADIQEPRTRRSGRRENSSELVKKELRKFLESIPIDWLLSGEPWVRYRTLTDILGKGKEDEEVVAAKESIRDHKLIKRIFDWQNRDGYWGTPRDIYTWWPKKNTTFWILGILADFGLSRKDEEIGRACEYVFSTQLPSGGFGCAPPPTPYECFTGILTESLAKSGYGPDARLKNGLGWLTQRQRLDGGFWCKNTGLPGGPREKEASCAFATLCVLGALIQDPELRNGPVVRKSAEFLFKCWENRGKMKYAGHDSRIGKGWEKLKYPFTDYRILKYLDTLSQFESSREDPRMSEMAESLIQKEDENGRFYPESIHKTWSDFDFGQKKAPSRWITLIVYRIAKRLLRPISEE